MQHRVFADGEFETIATRHYQPLCIDQSDGAESEVARRDHLHATADGAGA